VQHLILIEDRNATSQQDDTELENDSGPSAGGGPVLLPGWNTPTRQQKGGHSRGGSLATPSGITDLSGHAPADGIGTILCRHDAFHIVHNLNQGGVE
jgi:hypothetical protein